MKPITLSFDNGPDPEVTPRVLDVLAKHDIRASFFVIGDKLRDPHRLALCQRAHAEGHWLGNHTFHHLVPLGLSEHEGASRFEIGRTQELLGNLAHERKFFRPFGGGGHINTDLLDHEAHQILVEGAFTCVLWNVVPRDWAMPNRWVESALSQCASVEHPLVVLHDLLTGAMDHLDRFIGAAKDQGMTFVQDLPADCVPIESGIDQKDVSGIISV